MCAYEAVGGLMMRHGISIWPIDVENRITSMRSAACAEGGPEKVWPMKNENQPMRTSR